MNRQMRITIHSDGSLAIVDPGFDALPLLRSVNPDFRIQRAPLPAFYRPKFQTARKITVGYSQAGIRNKPESDLWEIHRAVIQAAMIGQQAEALSGQASLLDLKIELAQRLLTHCCLCGHRCGVNRWAGERGRCGLGRGAFLMDTYVHIAEEPPINPSLMMTLAGCGLTCVFCQHPEYRDLTNDSGIPLNATVWEKLNTRGARSLSFIGGNPDESLFAILSCLRTAPPDWRLPLVWNCHAYTSEETTDLLAGIVDAFVPDFKYGCTDCSLRLSGAPGYPETAGLSISAMIKQNVPVFVRLLVLPGHVDCCHIPVLDSLAGMDSALLWISLRGQYNPEYLISDADTRLTRRPSAEEIMRVAAHAHYLDLSLIEG